jgi:hypothetical protein
MQSTNESQRPIKDHSEAAAYAFVVRLLAELGREWRAKRAEQSATHVASKPDKQPLGERAEYLDQLVKRN